MSRDKDSPLTWHGRPILTVALAAARQEVDQAAMRQALRRPPMRDLPPIAPAPVDARTPTWWQDEFDVAWDSRPGKGVSRRRDEPARHGRLVRPTHAHRSPPPPAGPHSAPPPVGPKLV